MYMLLTGTKALKREYPYVFADLKYPGVPQVKLHTIDAENNIQIGDTNTTTNSDALPIVSTWFSYK